MIAMIATIIVSTVVCFVLVRSISNPLKALATTAQSVANGDLTVKPIAHSSDEVGLVAESFQLDRRNATVGRFRTERACNRCEKWQPESALERRSLSGGLYAELITGMNATLDAVSTPIDEAVKRARTCCSQRPATQNERQLLRRVRNDETIAQFRHRGSERESVSRGYWGRAS